jgi:hypothetical protein
MFAIGISPCSLPVIARSEATKQSSPAPPLDCFGTPRLKALRASQ